MGGTRLWMYVSMLVHKALSMFANVNMQVICLHLVDIHMISRNISSVGHGPLCINLSNFPQNPLALASNQCTSETLSLLKVLFANVEM